MQITRLEATWKELRREYTESAVLFEKNLKPFMKSLNEGDGEWLCLHRLCKFCSARLEIFVSCGLIRRYKDTVLCKSLEHPSFL